MDLEHNKAKIVNLCNYSIVIYKSSDSNVHTISSRSTHSGCELVWNTTEKSWKYSEFESIFRHDCKIIFMYLQVMI